MADRQPLLDDQPDHRTGGKAAGIGDQVEEILEMAEHAGDGDDPQRGLDEPGEPGRRPPPTDHEQHAQGVE